MTDRSGKPAGKPVYFNSDVIPAAELDSSSGDGGVLWANVPSGDYLITGSHPSLRFSSFRATCRPGRLINANPPWGLFEMAPGEDENPAVAGAPA